MFYILLYTIKKAFPMNPFICPDFRKPFPRYPIDWCSTKHHVIIQNSLVCLIYIKLQYLIFLTLRRRSLMQLNRLTRDDVSYVFQQYWVFCSHVTSSTLICKLCPFVRRPEITVFCSHVTSNTLICKLCPFVRRPEMTIWQLFSGQKWHVLH